MIFTDRRAAGSALARELAARTYPHPLVFALPRGGAPVAVEVAKVLNAPLDLLLVRKIGAPGQEELAVASIVDGERPDLVLNEDLVRRLQIGADKIKTAAKRELAEIERRRQIYLQGAAPLSAKGTTAILVDDGIATGASMKAAIRAVRRRQPDRIVVATPVAPQEVIEELASLADDVVCLSTPARFVAVGNHYEDFHQLEDDEVIALLAETRALR